MLFIRHHVGAALIGGVMLSVTSLAAIGQPPPPPAPGASGYGVLLTERDIDRAVQDLEALLVQKPNDDEARFALGFAQFLASGETLFQTLYRFGYDPDVDMIGWMLPFRVNPFPVQDPTERATYAGMRKMVGRWQHDLLSVEDTLARITRPDVSLRLKLGLVRLDFNDDGEAEPTEALFQLFNRLRNRSDVTLDEAREFEIAFDRGDVSWLRGYVHICLALSEFVLAHDWEDLFKRTAHLTFRDAITGYDFLQRSSERIPGQEQWLYVDFATMLHSIDFPVVEPDRCRAARLHLLEAIEMSRDMWSHYNAETDDDREWLPNTNQGSVFPGGEVTKEEQETWLLFLDEARAVLTGEHLLRFWRTADGLDRVEGRGVNLERVFDEPRTFDLILWIQGTAAKPYLEEGTLTTPKTWERLNEVFEQQFFRNAFWFN